jgi:hypothetical protein
MSAVITFSESNGAGESVTDSLTNLNFGSTDAPNLNTSSYPIVIGENSYEKYFRVKVGGSFTELSNMKIWKSAGTLLTGEVINAITNQAFATPVVTTSIVAVSAIPTSVGSALDIESTEGTATKFTTAGYSKYIVAQTTSTISTPTGAGNQKTLTVQWDEQ